MKESEVDEDSDKMIESLIEDGLKMPPTPPTDLHEIIDLSQERNMSPLDGVGLFLNRNLETGPELEMLARARMSDLFSFGGLGLGLGLGCPASWHGAATGSR